MNFNDPQLRELLPNPPVQIILPPPAPKPDPHFTHPSNVLWCGEWGEGGSGNGKLKGDGNYCHYFRACPRCFKMRVSRFYSQILNAISENGGVKIYYFDSCYIKVISKICESLGKKAYLRFPMEDNTIALMVGINEPISNDYISLCQGGRSYKYENKTDLYNLNIEELVRTPHGPKLTGKLGEKISTVNKAQFTIVAAVPIVVTDADEDTRILAFEQAVRNTPEKPTKVEDVPELVRKRYDEYAFLLQTKKFHANVFKTTEYRVLEINSILLSGNTEIEWFTIPEDRLFICSEMIDNYVDWTLSVKQSLRLHETKAKMVLST